MAAGWRRRQWGGSQRRVSCARSSLARDVKIEKLRKAAKFNKHSKIKIVFLKMCAQNTMTSKNRKRRKMKSRIKKSILITFATT